MGQGRAGADALHHLSPRVLPSGVPEGHRTTHPAALAVAVGVVLIAVQAAVLAADGPLMSPDSAVYQSAAEHLLDGRGLVDFTGRAVAVFPPGTSLLLAALRGLGLPGPWAWAVIDLAALAAFLVATWRTLRIVAPGRRAAEVLLAAVGIVAVASGVFSVALSDPAFTALLAWFTLVSVRVLAEQRPTTGRLVAIGLLAGTAFGVRYVGAYLVVLAVLLAVWTTRRARAVLVTLAAAGAVPVLVVVANRIGAGSATGERLPAATTIGENLSDALTSARQLAVGPAAPIAWGTVAVILAVVAVGLLFRNPPDRSGRALRTWLGLVVAGFLAFTVVSASAAPVDRLSARFLVPVLMPTAALAGSLVGPVTRSRRNAAGLVAGLAALVLVAAGGIVSVAQRTDPAGGLWHDDAVAAALDRLDPGATTHSNAPYLVWYHSGRDAQWLPSETAYRSTARPEELPRFETYLACSGAVELVWIGPAYAAGTYPPEAYGLPALPFDGVEVRRTTGSGHGPCEAPDSFGTGTGQR